MGLAHFQAIATLGKIKATGVWPPRATAEDSGKILNLLPTASVASTSGYLPPGLSRSSGVCGAFRGYGRPHVPTITQIQRGQVGVPKRWHDRSPALRLHYAREIASEQDPSKP